MMQQHRRAALLQAAALTTLLLLVNLVDANGLLRGAFYGILKLDD
jgi:hypothetical protein